MNNIEAYISPGSKVKIEQTRVQREWMNLTDDRHAYRCFPVALANSIGYSISFLEDIEFVWDGVSDSSDTHIKIIKGHDFCSPARGNATVSFNCNIFFKTEENVSMLSIVPPNYFIDGATPFTSILSTSFHNEVFPIAWKVTRPNVNILIPAGTPVATLIPISLRGLGDFQLNLHTKIYEKDHHIEQQNRIEAWEKISKEGGFTNFYRDAVDYKGNSIGQHEVKSLVLKINDYRDIEKW